MAVISEIVYQVFQVRKVQRMSLLIIIPQETEILFTYAIVGNAHSQAVSSCATNGEESVIVKQAAEIFNIRYLFGWERGMQVYQYLSFCSNFFDGAHATPSWVWSWSMRASIFNLL